MKRLPSHHPSHRGLNWVKAATRRIENHPETVALMRNLDAVYERLRQRARAEWLRHHAGGDPSDACVSVRIRCASGAGI